MINILRKALPVAYFFFWNLERALGDSGYFDTILLSYLRWKGKRIFKGFSYIPLIFKKYIAANTDSK